MIYYGIYVKIANILIILTINNILHLILIIIVLLHIHIHYDIF